MNNSKQFEARLKILISQIIFNEIENSKARNATVTEVKLNKDGSIAGVFVTFPAYSEDSLYELQKKAGYIRHRVAGNIDKKYCPYFKFHLDKLLDQINHWETKLAEVIKKDNDIKLKTTKISKPKKEAKFKNK